jgi:Protein of unknown function (DUF1553)/Protein of unknown function (DUF1549)
MHGKSFFCWLCWLSGTAILFGMACRISTGEESLPQGLQVVSLEARPAKIELKHRFDYSQLTLTGKLASGESVDLTRLAQKKLSGSAATLSPEGLVQAQSDGSGEIVCTFEAHTVKVPVSVANFATPREVSFVQDVQPVLAKMGCNQGTCHGAKDGKAGFKLSLRGYDPLYDHRALTDDIAARRFNRAAPDQSLFLLKGTGSIPHVGGARMQVDDPYYRLLREWIAQGVKLDLEKPRVAKIEIWPLDPILPRANMNQQFTVTATYANGETRDVTRDAFIESGNIEILEAKPSGVISTLRRGESPVLVRYEGAYAATTVIVMGDRSGFTWQETPSNNYIDEFVHKKLQRVKIQPSDLCTDAEFVRRLYLDLTGEPPSAQQVRDFLADARESNIKRNDLIEQLVGSPEYVELWSNKWADMLQVNRKFLGEQGAIALRDWIKNAVAANMPYDAFARQVLMASGSTLENPPAAYYKILREPESLMENTTHLFLAVRFNCNKCHDHPFERWTQDQYYQLSAYFAQIGRKEDRTFAGQKIGGSAVEGAAPLVEVVYDAGSGEVTHNRTGKQTPPSFPYQPELSTANTQTRRQQLATWLTSSQNQYFAKSYVNRLWGYLLGTGIIEPIDDIRAGNPPTNPELLDALTRDFLEHGFDVQHVVKQICRSRTYQRSVITNRWNDDDTLNYSHAIPRRLPAEVLFDAIHVATGSQARINGAPAGFRAAELPDAGVSDPFLDDFGRPVRESACECERSSGMVLGPIMKLVNGPTISNAIADPGSEIAKLVATETNDTKLITEVFLRFLAREPSPAEIQLGLEAMQTGEADRSAAVAKLQAYEAQLASQQAEWEKSLAQPVTWSPLAFQEMKSSSGATFTSQPDHAIVVGGEIKGGSYTLTAATELAGITGVKLEALPHDALPAKGPGRAENGNFVLSELKLLVADKASPDKAQPIRFTAAAADFSQASWAASGAIDGRTETGWAIMPAFGKAHQLTAKTSQAVGAADGSLLTFQIEQHYQDGKHNLGHFRISITNAPNPLGGEKLPEDVAAALAVAADQRNAGQQQVLTNYYRGQDATFVALQADVKRSEEALKNQRLNGVQDLMWALVNSPAFLFNR